MALSVEEIIRHLKEFVLALEEVALQPNVEPVIDDLQSGDWPIDPPPQYVDDPSGEVDTSQVVIPDPVITQETRLKPQNIDPVLPTPLGGPVDVIDELPEVEAYLPEPEASGAAPVADLPSGHEAAGQVPEPYVPPEVAPEPAGLVPGVPQVSTLAPEPAGEIVAPPDGYPDSASSQSVAEQDAATPTE